VYHRALGFACHGLLLPVDSSKTELKLADAVLSI
jgi:hypothetical protein